jgi:DNA polymerase
LVLRREGAKSSVAKLDALLAVQRDGRVYNHLQYHGASTGRWTGRGVQPQNLPRDKAKVTPDYYDDTPEAVYAKMQAEGLDVLNTISASIRNFFSPTPGCVFYVGDYATIEARLVFYLAGYKDMLEKMQAGLDVYCWAASDYYGREITKADERERFMFKCAILGCGYGMGPPRFSSQYSVSEADGEQCVGWYRNKFENVKKFWRELEKAWKRALLNSGIFYAGPVAFRYDRRSDGMRLRLPSGRVLRYHKPKIIGDPKDWQSGLTYEGFRAIPGTTTRQWAEIRIWGGTILENVCQATARDLSVEAMFDLELEGYPVVLQVHDEIVSEAPENRGIERFREIMMKPVRWAPDFPIGVEAKVLPYYGKI